MHFDNFFWEPNYRLVIVHNMNVELLKSLVSRKYLLFLYYGQTSLKLPMVAGTPAAVPTQHHAVKLEKGYFLTVDGSEIPLIL